MNKIVVGSVWKHGVSGRIGTVVKVSGDYIEMRIMGGSVGGIHFTRSQYFNTANGWQPYNDAINQVGGRYGE